MTIDPSATLDIVGGQLNTGGLIDNGTINVDGDPPALFVTGPAMIGSGGTLTAEDGSVIFTNGSLLNAGTLTADFGGSVLINESGINTGIIRAIDGGIVIQNGTIVNSGTIKADVGTIALYSTHVDNKDGLITALGCAASIVLADTAVAGGTVEARHDGVVDLDHATIIGSTIETRCGGTIEVVAMSGDDSIMSVFDGSHGHAVTIDGCVLVDAGANLELRGAIRNEGTIAVGVPERGDDDPNLIIDGKVDLTGSGTVDLFGPGDNIIGASADDACNVLVNCDNAISGARKIGGSELT